TAADRLHRGHRPVGEGRRGEVRDVVGRTARWRRDRAGEGIRMSALSVATAGAASEAVAAAVPTLVADRVASRLFGTDATLWGVEAEPEASIRLSWTALPRSSRPLVGQISALRGEVMTADVDRVVLCGMGGSSLAPEVICGTVGKD